MAVIRSAQKATTVLKAARRQRLVLPGPIRLRFKQLVQCLAFHATQESESADGYSLPLRQMYIIRTDCLLCSVVLIKNVSGYWIGCS